MIIKQRVLPDVGHGDDIGIWEGSSVYEVLYFMFEVEAIIGLMAKFMVKVTIFIKVPSKRHMISYMCGI